MDTTFTLAEMEEREGGEGGRRWIRDGERRIEWGTERSKKEGGKSWMSEGDGRVQREIEKKEERSQ